MRKIRPIARRFPLDHPLDDMEEWRHVPLEEGLRAVREKALFGASLEQEAARRRGEEPQIATQGLLPIGRKRPLGQG